MDDFQRAIDEIALKTNCGLCIPKNAAETAISAMQELQQYRQIGTVEECREAREKQEPMEVTDIHVDEYYCPACGTENCCDQGIVGDKHCPYCGQALKQRGIK